MESSSQEACCLLSEIHFYIMWFSLLTCISILIKPTVCHYFRPTIVKITVLSLMIFSAISWISHLSKLKSYPDFSGLSELDLLKEKHLLSKLQRNIYLEGTETFYLLLLLVVPRYQQYYEDTLLAFDRRLKQMISNK